MQSIYTRSGDGGETGLLGGRRVSKADARCDALGTVDELNAALGRLRCELPAGLGQEDGELAQVQNLLFRVGTHLATPAGSEAAARPDPLPGDPVPRLEKAIDRIQQALPPLAGFILPGGHLSAAQAHVCRTICRRAERMVVRLAAQPGAIEPERSAPIVALLNRLADYLFAVARRCNQASGRADVPRT